MKNKKIRQRTAEILTMVTLLSYPAGSVYAGTPEVSVDETMYVTMDYYGSPRQVTVVKGCTANGNESYTDYGSYSYVTNMTDSRTPKLEDGQVTWELPSDNKRFYYECGMETNQAELPWNFDVSYQLNGVKAKAEELAGASGLVEINVSAQPNEKARTYDKNNMILIAAVPVNMESSYSLQAPGAQLQSMGSIQAAVFTLLPGETGDFNVSIGTDSFETTGIMFMMMPGTTDSLDYVKDVKEVKDTWEESGDAMYESLNQMLVTVEAMEEGVREMYSGMQNIDEAREKASQSGDALLAGNEETLNAMSALTAQMEALIPDLQTAKEASGAINQSMNELVNNVGELKRALWILEENLYKLEDNTEDMADMTGYLQSTMESLIEIDDRIQEELQNIEELLEQLEGIDAVDEIADKISAKLNLLNKLATQSNALRKKCEAAVDHGGNVLIEAGILSSQATAIIEEMEDLNETLNLYEPQFEEALGDCQLLLQKTAEALDTGTSTIGILQETLKETKEPVETGTRESLQGMLKVMDKTIAMFGDTKAVREAAEAMKASMDSETDKLESDTNFLNIDPSARKLSFTSSKNQEPNSLQIVLRTDEISLDDEADITDMEPEKAPENPFARMWKVVTRIFYAVIDIFQTR